MKCDLSLRRKCRLVLDGETGAIWTKITPVAQMVGGLPTLSPPSFMISDTDSCVWHGSQYSNWSYTLRSQWRIEEHSFMSLKTVHVLCNFHSCPSSFLSLFPFLASGLLPLRRQGSWDARMKGSTPKIWQVRHTLTQASLSRRRQLQMT